MVRAVVARCPVHEATAPDRAEGDAEQDEPGVVARRPAMPSTTARDDAGEHRGQAGLLAGEAEALEGAGARRR